MSGNSDGDATNRDRLPRRRGGGDGHGVHRRAHRPRRRARHPRRPSPCGRRALAGRLPVRPAAPGVAVLRRRVDRARHRRRAASRARRPACRSEPVESEIQATTTTSCTAASSARAASRSSEVATTTRTAASHLVTSLVSGETVQVDVRRRVVDATYLSPTIPATTPPPFGVADGVDVVAVNELATLTAAPSDFVIVGSGKTATDGIVWLLANGVPPDRIVWVRPRDPWMLDRAVVQPDPVVALGLAADTMAAAADAESLDDLFLRLEAAGVMLRIDRRRRARPWPRRRPSAAGSSTCSARSSASSGSGTSRHVDRRRDRSRRGLVPLAPALTRRALRGVGTAATRRWSRSGGPTRSDSRRSGPASRASAPPWPATSRPPATTTGSATGCVRRTRSPTTRANWARDAGARHPGGARLRRRAGHRHVGERLRPEPGAPRPVPGATTLRCGPPSARLADVAERGLARMAELARISLSGRGG